MLKAERTELKERLAQVRLLAMDVDGVLSDGSVAYDSDGGEQKRFHVSDGLGLVVLKQAGIPCVWISGRSHAGVERRGAELRVFRVLQGVRDKQAALQQLSAETGIALQETAYIGDDWNDLPAFRIVGIRIAVANAAIEVKTAADLVTNALGGHGAVREVCMALLDARGIREQVLQGYLRSLSHSLTAGSGQEGSAN